MGVILLMHLNRLVRRTTAPTLLSVRIWASPPPRRASRRPGLDRIPHNEARPPNAQHLNGQLWYGGAESQRIVEGAQALLEELRLRMGTVEERLDDGRRHRPSSSARSERHARPAAASHTDGSAAWTARRRFVRARSTRSKTAREEQAAHAAQARTDASSAPSRRGARRAR
ncbi:hypothetical protein T492DRAFT_1139653 [Pavlovales sp. CCMP2436]|nr:hypothetical protein T492DRAFT_1139653 [Pavlovales sp. CCMP2436]